MLNDPRAAALACLCQYSFDMGVRPVNPPADPRLIADGYTLRGHILGIDELLGVDTAACYGYLAEHADGHFALVTRGTFDIGEWYEDALGKYTGHPLGGRVHSGFWGVYTRFSYLELATGRREQLIESVGRSIGSAPIVVVGHSLGGATAAYAALDLAADLSGQQVSGAFFESPKPGDAEFAALFERFCPNYTSWAAEDDEVPDLPDLGGLYVNLLKTRRFKNEERQALIAPGVANAHHVAGVAASLYWKLKDWQTWGGARDADLVKIILGPAPGI